MSAFIIKAFEIATEAYIIIQFDSGELIYGIESRIPTIVILIYTELRHYMFYINDYYKLNICYSFDYITF
jgi:hypothetical protein